MLTPQYITDGKGKKIFVVLSMKDYKKIMEDIEEMEDIRQYDEAKSLNEPSVPAYKAFRQIDAKRNLIKF